MSDLVEAAIKLRMLLRARFVDDIQAIDALVDALKLHSVQLQERLNEFSSVSEKHDVERSRALERVALAISDIISEAVNDVQIGEPRMKDHPRVSELKEIHSSWEH